MLPLGWIILASLAAQAPFWGHGALAGRRPAFPWTLLALAGGIAMAAAAWHDSHMVLLAGQAMALAVYLAALRAVWPHDRPRTPQP